jgi:hypothetical protein
MVGLATLAMEGSIYVNATESSGLDINKPARVLSVLSRKNPTQFAYLQVQVQVVGVWRRSKRGIQQQ